jgi:hypothetical protein
MVNEQDDFKYHVPYFKDMLDYAYSDALNSYDVLMNYDGDLKYQMSLSYFNMSFQSYLEAKRVRHLHELYHYEIEPFFTAYDDFKFQLKQVITEKDNNTSWLYGTYNRLIDSKKNLDEFINNSLKSAQ